MGGRACWTTPVSWGTNFGRRASTYDRRVYRQRAAKSLAHRCAATTASIEWLAQGLLLGWASAATLRPSAGPPTPAPVPFSAGHRSEAKSAAVTGLGLRAH